MIIVAVAYNNESILERDLMASPDISGGDLALIVMQGKLSATLTYNSILQQSNSTYIIFAHQDVYLPSGWCERVQEQIEIINRETNGRWLAIGCAGVSFEGGIVGHVWSSSINKIVGGEFDDPIEVQSIDELIIIVNTVHGYKFDDRLPGYHFYGTDIVQTGKKMGLKSFVINAPVVHNDAPKPILGRDYLKSYKYMQHKWRDDLPIVTTVMPLCSSSANYYIRNMRHRVSLWMNKWPASYKGDPIEIAKKLGFED